MTRILIVIGLVLVIAGGSLSALSESGNADTAAEEASEVDATPTEVPSTPTAEVVTNREDCDAIRGNDYLSPEERTWFLSNCITR